MAELQERPEVYGPSAAARRVGISSQLLFEWRKTAALLPSAVRRRKGSRRKVPVYTHRDVICGILLKGLRDQLGFQGEGLRKIVHFAQTGTEEQLANAWILTARMGNGILKPVFVYDCRLDPASVAETFNLSGTFTDGEELIATLKSDGRYLDHVTLLDAMSQIARGMDETEEKRQIGEAALHSGNEAA